MIFIPLVKLSIDSDDVYIPFVTLVSPNQTVFAHFKCYDGECFDTFIKRYAGSHQCSEKAHFFLREHLALQRKFENPDLSIYAWKVRDEEKRDYYLVSLGTLDEWDDLASCFCIPQHYFNLLQLYKNIKELYPCMAES